MESVITKDLESLSALGRSLTAARDHGVITPEDFAPSARALAVAMLTGMMEMEAYAGIHWVLGRMLEAAFSSPAKVQGDDLDTHVEAVGRMWSYVGPSGEGLLGVDRFLDRAFHIERARFGRQKRFQAPLKAAPAQIATMLRASGIILHSREGSPLPAPRSAIMADVNYSEPGERLLLGWGERRMALLFVAEAL